MPEQRKSTFEMSTLGDVCYFENGDRGKNYPSKGSFIEKGIPFINAGNLKNWTINQSSLNYISEEKFNLLTNGKVKKGDILFCLRGSIGKFAVVNNIITGGIASSLVIIRVQSSLDAGYLMYYLYSPLCKQEINRFENGAAQPNLSARDLKKFKIPLPPLAEQQKIAAILDAADQLRQKDQQLIDHYTTLSQSLFLDMFGDPVTNSMGWDVLELEDMLEFLTSGSRGWAKYYSDKGDLFLRIQNVEKNRLILEDVAYVTAPDSTEAKRTRVKAGDILLSITADLGRTAVIPESLGKAHINQHLAIIRLKKGYNSHYVSEYISSLGGKRQLAMKNKGGVKAGLNFADIKSLKILNPPIKIQKRYLEQSEKIEQQKHLAQASLEKSETLFNSLLQRAFKGELTQ